MDYSPNLCFASFNLKGGNLSKKEEKKSNCSSLCLDSVLLSRQRSSKWLRKSVTTIFLLSQHKGLNIKEKLCHDKRQRVATKHKKNVTSQLRQREIMLRQGFLCWMSKPGGTYRDIKAPVVTLETGRKQRFCHDKVSYVAIRN